MAVNLVSHCVVSTGSFGKNSKINFFVKISLSHKLSALNCFGLKTQCRDELGRGGCTKTRENPGIAKIGLTTPAGNAGIGL